MQFVQLTTTAGNPLHIRRDMIGPLLGGDAGTTIHVIGNEHLWFWVNETPEQIQILMEAASLDVRQGVAADITLLANAAHTLVRFSRIYADPMRREAIYNELFRMGDNGTAQRLEETAARYLTRPAPRP